MENYLQEKHAEEYTGTDDNMSDSFDVWMLDLDVDEWIEYADGFAVEQLQERIEEDILLKKNQLIKLSEKMHNNEIGIDTDKWMDALTGITNFMK